ncbi:MAG: LysM peptidoglycan-binding domain-containing protein [Clostridia bacterium]|nr:LysM peptidoglycan-binding domain-containing protein [Clostridia bacterium]
MLRSEWKKYYKVKEGQSLRSIAEAFCVSEFLLAKINGLQGPPFAGQVLEIPTPRGNAYTVKRGDTKTLLCGGDEQFERKNGTDILYLGMRVIL